MTTPPTLLDSATWTWQPFNTSQRYVPSRDVNRLSVGSCAACKQHGLPANAGVAVRKNRASRLRPSRSRGSSGCGRKGVLWRSLCARLVCHAPRSTRFSSRSRTRLPHEMYLSQFPFPGCTDTPTLSVPGSARPETRIRRWFMSADLVAPTLKLFA